MLGFGNALFAKGGGFTFTIPRYFIFFCFLIKNLRFLLPLRSPCTDDVNNVLVRDHVAQSDSLGDVPCARPPDQRILERVLERPVDGVAHVLDGTVAPHDERLVKVGLHALALGVDADEAQLLPAPVDDVLDPEVELAAHDHRVRLARQLVQEVERHAVDLVVHVQALDVLAVVLHDDVDEVVHGRVLVANEDLAVEDLVVAEDVVEHLLVEILGRGLECDFHAARLLRF